MSRRVIIFQPRGVMAERASCAAPMDPGFAALPVGSVPRLRYGLERHQGRSIQATGQRPTHRLTGRTPATPTLCQNLQSIAERGDAGSARNAAKVGRAGLSLTSQNVAVTVRLTGATQRGSHANSPS